MKQGSTGLYARLAGSADLRELLEPGDPAGAAARMVPNWPEEVLEDPQDEHFPLITWIRPVWVYHAEGVAESDFDLHLWTWPMGARGDGEDLMDALEACMMELFGGQGGKVWHHDGCRLHSNLEPVMNDPASARDEPHSRTVKLSLLVSRES